MKSISPLKWLASGFAGGLVVIALMESAQANVAGILSFVAVGLLSILVGYLAPAPPSAIPSAKGSPKEKDPK